MYYASWPVGRSSRFFEGRGGGRQAGRQAGKVAAVEEARSFARCCCVGARSVEERRGEGGRERCRAMGGGRDPASAAGKQQEVFANLLLLLPR